MLSTPLPKFSIESKGIFNNHLTSYPKTLITQVERRARARKHAKKLKRKAARLEEERRHEAEHGPAPTTRLSFQEYGDGEEDDDNDDSDFSDDDYSDNSGGEEAKEYELDHDNGGFEITLEEFHRLDKDGKKRALTMARNACLAHKLRLVETREVRLPDRLVVVVVGLESRSLSEYGVGLNSPQI